MKRTALAEPKTVTRLRLKEIKGHLTFSRSGPVVAWYALPSQPWAFRSDSQRLGLVLSSASRHAVLHGRALHGRVTTRPYPVRKWVEALDKNTPTPLGGKATGSPWDQNLVRVQEHLKATTMADKEVYVGVDIGTASTFEEVAAFMLRRDLDQDERVTEDISVISEVMAGPGIEARPCTPDEMEWLMRRSVGVGLPMAATLSPLDAPDWDSDDLHTFTDSVTLDPRPLSKVTRVVSEEGVERFVAVLSVGRVESIEVPDPSRDPWMSMTDRLPFPVEWSYRVQIIAGGDASAAVNTRLLVGRDMQRHYRDHNVDTPLDVQRKIDTARRVMDEMQTGSEIQANRAYGWFRLAVSARTEKDCLKRVRAVRDLYRPVRIAIEHPKGQEGLLREFIPGEPLSTTAHRRRLPVLYLAAGMPTVSSTLGDKRGHYIGYTVGTSRRPVMCDPHFGPEVREKSGLIPVVGGLGSGKSHVLGSLAWAEFEAGVPSTVWDPSGPLAALVLLAHEMHGKHSARHLNLMKAEEGRLSPYSIIAEPLRHHFEDEAEYEAAKIGAASERKVLALDVCRSLTFQIGEEGRTRKVLMDAIRVTGGRRGGSLVNVVDHLRKHPTDHEHGNSVADLLMDAREHPMTRLYFGAGRVSEEHDEPSGLDVVTMAGIDKPDLTVDRQHWSTEQVLAYPLLSLAIYYTSRRIYSGPMRARKFVGLDEAHFLADWPSGRALLRRLATDSRKWNACVVAASQNAGHVLSLDIANLIGTALVGRTEDADHAREGLRLLRVPEGSGYEHVLHNLSPNDPRTQTRSGYREFVMMDVDGSVDKMRWDLSHNPRLLAALDTTANPLEVAA